MLAESIRAAAGVPRPPLAAPATTTNGGATCATATRAAQTPVEWRNKHGRGRSAADDQQLQAALDECDFNRKGSPSGLGDNVHPDVDGDVHADWADAWEAN